MALRGVSIGYAPYDPNCAATSDRRRFCRYAALRQLDYDVALKPRFGDDIVLVSSMSDISGWAALPKHARTKLIFELTDSYLAGTDRDMLSLLRGPMKYAAGHLSRFEPSYRQALIRMCRRADAVICSTPEQAESIQRFNPVVFPILDFQSQELTARKTDFGSTGPKRLFWEGMGGNLITLRELKKPLERLASNIPLELHVVTDPTMRRFNAPVPQPSSAKFLRRLLPAVQSFVYPWNPFAVSQLAAGADLGVIPMHRDSAIHWAKPENKLLLMWRLGLPVLTSPTPAYRRTMAAAGLQMTCDNEQEWVDQLGAYLQDESAQEQAAAQGRNYAETICGETAIAERWDHALETVLDSGPGSPQGD